MAAWLPVLKVVLPYVTTVATAAIPAFTSRKGGEKSTELMAQQIAELQGAAAQNAESVKLLAEQLQRTLEGLEEAAARAEQAQKQTRAIAVAGVAVALLALLTASFVLASL